MRVFSGVKTSALAFFYFFLLEMGMGDFGLFVIILCCV